MVSSSRKNLAVYLIGVLFLAFLSWSLYASILLKEQEVSSSDASSPMSTIDSSDSEASDLFGGSLVNNTKPFDVRSTWNRILAYSKLASTTPYDRIDFLQLGRRTRSLYLLSTILHDRPELHPMLATTTSIATLADLTNFRSVLETTIQAFTHQLYWWIQPRFNTIRDLSRHYTVLNSTIPVEVWHLGPKDLEPSMIQLLSSLREEAKGLEGWDVKPFAMLASSFREVIFLDADVMFLQDPHHMLDTSELYRQHGQLFYHDRTLWGGEPHFKSIAWFEGFVPVPSRFAMGLRFMTKGRTGVLHALMATCKMNSKVERDGSTYRYIYGDKETFWMSWEMLRIPYSFVPTHGGAIGYLDPTRSATCGSLYHAEFLRPLWWNGGLRRQKRNDTSLYIHYEYASADMDSREIEWHWDSDTEPFCLTVKGGRGRVRLSKGMRGMAERFVEIHRGMREEGVEKWMESVEGVLKEVEEIEE
ncbi:mannosyltransferase putative-domain-containing protein [Chytridium lagenaria]|nr:mannosyltransferase putative-domain-containing protein [Chytridium lagenaria]